MRRRSLTCERCNRSQYVVGRPVLEIERELSYRWCRDCLDGHGPAAELIALGGDPLRDGWAEEMNVYLAQLVEARGRLQQQQVREGLRAFVADVVGQVQAQVGDEVILAPAAGRAPRDLADKRLLVMGAKARYVGSKAEHHGPCKVLDITDEVTVVVELKAKKAKGKKGKAHQLRCNWNSIAPRD